MSRYKVFSLTHDGEGQVIVADKEISIPFVLPGEEISLHALKKGRRTQYTLEELLSKSPWRASPICAHFTQCGGCVLQHMDNRFYREFKKSIVIKALFDLGIDPFLCLDPIWFTFGQRRRSNLDGIKKDSKMILGFHQLKRHSLVDVLECHMLHPNLFNLLDPLRNVFNRILLPFQKVKIFMLDSDTGLDVGIEIQGLQELSSVQRDCLIDFFSKEATVSRAFFRFRKYRDILDLKTTPHLLFGGIPVEVDAYGFVQSCKAMDDFLFQSIQQWFLYHRPQKIMDLFCGLGTLTLPLSRYAFVEGFEIDDGAIEKLIKAAKDYPIKITKRDLFNDPVKDFDYVDFVVINPPRAGALAQIEHLALSRVPRIAYLSCNPKTMARDLKVLCANYRIESIQPVDQFVGTFHIECLAMMRHKST